MTVIDERVDVTLTGVEREQIQIALMYRVENIARQINRDRLGSADRHRTADEREGAAERAVRWALKLRQTERAQLALNWRRCRPTWVP